MPNLSDLREMLFEELRRVQSPHHEFNAARTRAATEIAGRICDTARLEIDYNRAAKRPVKMGFIEATTQDENTKQTATGTLTREGNVTTHKMA